MDSRKAAEKLLCLLDIDHNQYKFGHTKVGSSSLCKSRAVNGNIIHKRKLKVDDFFIKRGK